MEFAIPVSLEDLSPAFQIRDVTETDVATHFKSTPLLRNFLTCCAVSCVQRVPFGHVVGVWLCKLYACVHLGYVMVARASYMCAFI